MNKKQRYLLYVGLMVALCMTAAGCGTSELREEPPVGPPLAHSQAV